MWQPDRALRQLENEGRTRAWVAKYCGMTPQSINNFLAGRRSPTKPILKLMAQALNTTESYLMGEDMNFPEEVHPR